MARGAPVRRPAVLMTGDTRIHPRVVHGAHLVHLGDRPVTPFAGDPVNGQMLPMAEDHKIGDARHPLPGHGLAALGETTQSLNVRGVSMNLDVAGHAGRRLRQGGLFPRIGKLVTLAALKVCRQVRPVAEGNRLLGGRGRRAVLGREGHREQARAKAGGCQRCRTSHHADPLYRDRRREFFGPRGTAIALPPDWAYRLVPASARGNAGMPGS